jgi:hypothetical protein
MKDLAEKLFGFRPAASTDKASYRLINEILDVMNDRKVAGGISCDLRRHLIMLTVTSY